MNALIAALLGILAAFGVIILLVLRTLIQPSRPLPSGIARWSGHTGMSFFNYPPQAWAAP